MEGGRDARTEAARKVQAVARGRQARARAAKVRASKWKATYDVQRRQYKYVHSVSGLFTWQQPPGFEFQPLGDPHWRAAIMIQKTVRMLFAKLRVAIMRRARSHRDMRRAAAEAKEAEFQRNRPGPRIVGLDGQRAMPNRVTLAPLKTAASSKYRT